MTGVANGDESALRALIARWEGPVFAFLERMLGSPDDAQDLGQETFLRLHQHAGRYRPSGQFKSWLFRIVGNLARSRLRRRRIVRWIPFRQELHDRETGTDAPSARIEREETGEWVRSALASLPDRQREAMVLRHYQDMSYREIAATMNTTTSAVEALLARAMSALRSTLGKAGQNER